MENEDKEVALKLNQLAREQMIYKLLKDIEVDLTVCKLENQNPKEYIERLKWEIDNLYYKFNNKGKTK